MDDTTHERLEALMIDASTVVEHADELRADTEDYAAVLPKELMTRLRSLVVELRDLRDDIRGVQIDSGDDAVDPTSPHVD